jgi:colicin import membrane protein
MTKPTERKPMPKTTKPTENKAPSTALALPETKDLQVAFKDGTINAMLDRIVKEAESFVPDLSTAKSRSEITSLAATVARSKRPLDDARKMLTEEWREKTSEVNAHWKVAETRLDALRDKIKKPLIDWEAIDTQRKDVHRANLVAFNPDRTDHTMSVEQIDVIITEVNGIGIGVNWDEFKTIAETAREAFLSVAERNRMFADVREKQAAQIAQLEKDKADREEADRIAGEAAALKAEEDAVALLKAADDKAKAEREALALKEAAEKAEQDRIWNDKAAISLMDYITACDKGMIGHVPSPVAMIIYELENKIPSQIEKLAETDRPRAEQHRKNVLQMLLHNQKVENDRIKAEQDAAALVAEKEAAERTLAAEQAAIERTKTELAEKVATEAANKAAEAARLLADDKHRKGVLMFVTADLKNFDVKDMAQAILDGKIRHVTMQL